MIDHAVHGPPRIWLGCKAMSIKVVSQEKQVNEYIDTKSQEIGREMGGGYESEGSN